MSQTAEFERYTNPLDFENFLRTISPSLWIVEFRNAIDVINSYIEFTWDDELDEWPNEDLFIDSKRCVLMLAHAHCPDQEQELRERAEIKDSDREPCATEPTDVRNADQTTNNAETATESEPKRKKPSNSALEKSLEVLHTEQAKTIYEHLHKAGYLDSDHKPIIEKSAFVAFMAYIIAYGLFGIWNWSAVFTHLWYEETRTKAESQFDKKGLSAHLKNADGIWDTNSYSPLDRDRKEFIWELAKVIEAMGLNSKGAQRILKLARRNGYTSTKR